MTVSEVKFDIVGSIYGREYSEFGQFVSSEAFDAAQSELAALREELANEKARIPQYIAERAAAEQRLTATEQRNALLAVLLQRVVDSAALTMEQEASFELESLEADICAVLKPTESGVSE